VIDVGGVLFNDLSTAAFATNIDPKKIVSIGVNATRVGDKHFVNVRLRDVLVELTKKIKKFNTASYKNPTTMAMIGKADDKITWASLAPRYENFIKANDILFVETGTNSSACGGLKLPDDVAYHYQTLWGAIGWATPAAMGAALADISRRTVSLTGEGAHQLTVNEIGNFKRHDLKSIIFVLNNNGFGVERALEDYPSGAKVLHLRYKEMYEVKPD
jgi:indolepyruvate decarboxylase